MHEELLIYYTISVIKYTFSSLKSSQACVHTNANDNNPKK